MTPQQIKANAPEIIDYKKAKEIGMSYYFTGKPCMYNQIAIRDIKTRHCQCFICASKQRFKESEWAKNNKDNVAKRHKKWRKKNRTKPTNPVFIKPL